MKSKMIISIDESDELFEFVEVFLEQSPTELTLIEVGSDKTGLEVDLGGYDEDISYGIVDTLVSLIEEKNNVRLNSDMSGPYGECYISLIFIKN